MWKIFPAPFNNHRSSVPDKNAKLFRFRWLIGGLRGLMDGNYQYEMCERISSVCLQRLWFTGQRFPSFLLAPASSTFPCFFICISSYLLPIQTDFPLALFAFCFVCIKFHPLALVLYYFLIFFIYFHQFYFFLFSSFSFLSFLPPYLSAFINSWSLLASSSFLINF